LETFFWRTLLVTNSPNSQIIMLNQIHQEGQHYQGCKNNARDPDIRSNLVRVFQEQCRSHAWHSEGKRYLNYRISKGAYAAQEGVIPFWSIQCKQPAEGRRSSIFSTIVTNILKPSVFRIHINLVRKGHINPYLI
jgi:hypothetical protein